MKPTTIAIIGYGIQGTAVATKLRQQGHDLTVYDIDEQCIERAKKDGLKTAATLSKAAQKAKYILVIATAGTAPKDILLNPEFLAVLSPEKKVIQMGSYPYQDALEISKQLSSKKIPYMECILASPTAAIMAGACQLLFGGNRNSANELTEMFQPIGSILYIGDVGKAAAFNLASLNILYALAHGFAISATMIERSELDLSQWFDFLTSGFGQDAKSLLKMLTDFLWPVHFNSRNYQLTGPFQFKIEGAANESKMVTELAKQLELNTKLTEAINSIHQETEKSGKDKDWTAIYEFLCPQKSLKGK